MKKLNLFKLAFRTSTRILVVLLFFTDLAVAQEMDSLLQYYPLNKDDYWEYIVEKIDPINNKYEKRTYSLKVLGDTLFNNAKNYLILEKHDLDLDSSEYIFERIDVATAAIFSFNKDYPKFNTDEFLIDSLALLPNKSFDGFSRYTLYPAYITCVSFGVDTLLDEPVAIRTYRASDFFFDYTYTLAQNLGLVYARAVSPELTFEQRWHLRFALLNGKLYDFRTQVMDDKEDKKVQSKFLVNYPNPLNARTVIRYALPAPGQVRLDIYNLRGERVRTLVDAERAAGTHQVSWDGRNDMNEPVASGIYICRFQAGEVIYSRRLILLK